MPFASTQRYSDERLVPKVMPYLKKHYGSLLDPEGLKRWSGRYGGVSGYIRAGEEEMLPWLEIKDCADNRVRGKFTYVSFFGNAWGFSIDIMPSCCGMLIAHGWNRDTPLAEPMLDVMLDYARSLSYTVVQVNLVPKVYYNADIYNAIQKRKDSLLLNEWSFTSIRTHATIHTLMLNAQLLKV